MTEIILIQNADVFSKLLHMQISITLALSKFSHSCASFTSLFVYLTFYPINLGGVEKLASFDIARVPYNNMYSHTLLQCNEVYKSRIVHIYNFTHCMCPHGAFLPFEFVDLI